MDTLIDQSIDHQLTPPIEQPPKSDDDDVSLEVPIQRFLNENPFIANYLSVQPPIIEPPITEPAIVEPVITEPSISEPPIIQQPIPEPAITEPPIGYADYVYSSDDGSDASSDNSNGKFSFNEIII